MKKSPQAPPRHWWDWTSVLLLGILLQLVASRLIVTGWTEGLSLVRSFTWMGASLGLALGYSAFRRRTARWLSFFYMLLMLPLQWTTVIEGPVKVEEKLLSVAGRLLFSISELFARRPVEDPLFFIAIMSVTLWVLSASAGYHLVRHQNFLLATLPSLLGMLIIQNYDNAVASRLLLPGFFILFELLLVGRLNYLAQQIQWKQKRVFLSPENSLDLTSSMAIMASLIMITAWVTPSSFLRIEIAHRAWNRILEPWNNFVERFENAVSALDSPSGGKPGEFFGTELELGLGFPLSDVVMFTVETPDLPFNQKPPRYYWRGRVYDYFSQDQWFTTGTTREEYSPVNPLPGVDDTDAVSFLFNTGGQRVSLLYAPSQPVWVSRPGSMLAAPGGDTLDIFSWNATPSLLPGETYQVEAVLSNPTIEGLRAAGTDYPAWVTDKYLQLPDNFSQPIRDLALEITAEADTPYDKAFAITQYLRTNIAYAPTISSAPRGKDKLEWILFEYKQAYCVYYSSAQILMLRSLGIPARMAVGFSQGTGTSSGDRLASEIEDIQVNSFTVRKQNAHAWPEVYFPGIGWVEFEPTGNQAPLDRPLAPREDDADTGLINPGTLIGEELLPEEPLDPTADDRVVESASTPPASLLPTIYLLLTLLALAGLTVYLGRRYGIHERLPSAVRATLERTGVETPRWIIHWEGWVKLTSIERSFESINFGLRQLSAPPAIDATPIERADSLARILPDAASPIKILLDEHHTSLYTSRTADAEEARRAAFALRSLIILARLRHFWTGKYSPRS
jgi:transglutaminase-like putative cysteine protease